MDVKHTFFAFLIVVFYQPTSRASAQDISVQSVSPEIGAAGVPLETRIEIAFDDTLNMAADLGPYGPLVFFAIEPADSMDVGPPHFFEDGTGVAFDVSHTADTEFVWILSGAVSHEGGRLCDPGILSYSTGSGGESATVRGYASLIIAVKGGGACTRYYAPFVALLDRAPGPEARIVAAGAVDDVAEFEMTGVAAGTYWPVMFVDSNADGVIEPDFSRIGDLEAEVSAYRINGTISSLDVAASSTYDIVLEIYGGATTSGAELPGVAALTGNHPNPFRTTTDIGFRLERPVTGTFEAFDLLGRHVAMIKRATWTSGEHTARWSAPDIGPGTYFVRMTGPDFVLTLPVVKRP